MALYKDKNSLFLSNHKAFDKVYNIGDLAIFSGIYHCINCGYEITMITGNTFPPESESHKSDDHEIQWQLIVKPQKY